MSSIQELHSDDRAPADCANVGKRSRLPLKSRRAWRPELGIVTSLILALPLLALVALLLAYPIATLITGSASGASGWSIYLKVLGSHSGRAVLTNTFVISFAVALIAVAAAAILAWALRFTKHRWLRLFIWLAVLTPVCMGVVMKNYSFMLILGDNGLINSILKWVHIVDKPLPLLYNEGAIVAGMTYSMIPFALFPLSITFAGIEEQLMSASEGLGASRSRSVRDIFIPLAIPGLVAGWFVVFIMSLGFYVTPVLLGGGHTPFVATSISYDLFIAFDLPRAQATSVIVLAAAVASVLAALALVGPRRLMRALG